MLRDPLCVEVELGVVVSVPLLEELWLGTADPEALWLSVRLPGREGVREEEGLLEADEMADAGVRSMRRTTKSVCRAGGEI